MICKPLTPLKVKLMVRVGTDRRENGYRVEDVGEQSGAQVGWLMEVVGSDGTGRPCAGRLMGVGASADVDAGVSARVDSRAGEGASEDLGGGCDDGCHDGYRWC